MIVTKKTVETFSPRAPSSRSSYLEAPPTTQGNVANKLLSMYKMLEDGQGIFVYENFVDPISFLLYITPTIEGIRLSQNEAHELYRVYFKPEKKKVPIFVKKFLNAIEFNDNEVEIITSKLLNKIEPLSMRISSLNPNDIIFLKKHKANDFIIGYADKYPVNGFVRLSENSSDKLYNVYIVEPYEDLNYLRSFLRAIDLSESKIDVFIENLRKTIRRVKSSSYPSIDKLVSLLDSLSGSEVIEIIDTPKGFDFLIREDIPSSGFMRLSNNISDKLYKVYFLLDANDGVPEYVRDFLGNININDERLL